MKESLGRFKIFQNWLNRWKNAVLVFVKLGEIWNDQLGREYKLYPEELNAEKNHHASEVIFSVLNEPSGRLSKAPFWLNLLKKEDHTLFSQVEKWKEFSGNVLKFPFILNSPKNQLDAEVMFSRLKDFVGKLSKFQVVLKSQKKLFHADFNQVQRWKDPSGSVLSLPFALNPKKNHHQAELILSILKEFDGREVKAQLKLK